MAYPERNPIYQAYELIVKKIVEEKMYKEFADSEINALNTDLLNQFRMISARIVSNKFNEKSK